MPEDPARHGLGRGLEVLMGPTSAEATLVQLPVGSIVAGKFQPRRRFDEGALVDLTESVRSEGVVQPVLVRPVAAGYELIAGERRWRAAQAAGLPTIPAVIRAGDDAEALMLALVENVAREDLSPVEEARGYVALIEEFDMNLGDVAAKVGRSKPSVSNRIRLLELPDDVIRFIEEGTLSEGHASAVLALPNHEDRRRFARRIMREGLSVRAAEEAARRGGARQRRRRTERLDPVLMERGRRLLEQVTGSPARAVGSTLTVSPVDETALAELVESLENCLHSFSRDA